MWAEFKDDVRQEVYVSLLEIGIRDFERTATLDLALLDSRLRHNLRELSKQVTMVSRSQQELKQISMVDASRYLAEAWHSKWRAA